MGGSECYLEDGTRPITSSGGWLGQWVRSERTRLTHSLNLAGKKRKHRGERFPLARAAWGVRRRVREDLVNRLPHLARLDRRGRAPVASADHGDRRSAAGATTVVARSMDTRLYGYEQVSCATDQAAH